MARIEGNRRADIEDYLKRRGVKSFTYAANLSPSAADQDRSLQNQARLGDPLQDDLVDQYVTALKNRDSFPPLLCWTQPDGMLQLMDGNHRLAAYITLGRAVDAYIIDCSPDVRVRITMEANTRHGRPLSFEDKIHHALYMVDNDVSVAQAAAMFQLETKDLRKEVNKVNADRRAVDSEIPGIVWERMPYHMRTRLNALAVNEVFREVAVLASEAGWNLGELNKFITTVNKTKSVEEQLRIVSDARADAQEAIAARATVGNGLGRPKSVQGPRSRIRMVTGQLKTLSVEMMLAAIPAGERGAYIDDIDHAIKKMTEIRDGLRDGSIPDSAGHS